MARRLWISVVLVSLGCASGGHPLGPPGDDGGARSDGGRADGGAADAGRVDGGRLDAGRVDAGRVDAGRVDAGRVDAGRVDAGRDGGRGTPLDPLLRPADPSGAPCATPGSMSECPGIAVCRFFTAEEGRCESCTECGNLGRPCASGRDCDILFACYAGRCTNICPLGTFYCGPVEDCLDVGHPTHGVCRP